MRTENFALDSGSQPYAFVGASSCGHTSGSLSRHPDATPGAQCRFYTQAYCTSYPDYIPGEESESFSEGRSRLPVPAPSTVPPPHLDSFDIIYRSNKENIYNPAYAQNKQKKCIITFMMCRNNIMWASFRQ